MAFSVAVLVATALTVSPTPSGALAIDQAKVTINASAGNQADPHVDGALAAYTNGNEIRFFNFGNSADSAIPRASTDVDLLSDVNAGRIVFSRVMSDHTGIMLYDTTAALPSVIEMAPPTSPVTRFGAAIGGNTLVFADYSTGPGEILFVDLASPSTATNLTSDSINDQNPSVSPNGSVIAWERCEFSACDIYQNVRTGSGWATTGTLVSTNGAFPDTNGEIVAYEKPFSGGPTSDIFYRPVSGGAEVQLALSSEDHNPTVGGAGARTVIAFESRATSTQPSNLFLYEVATNRLFQLTNTPENETLNDVTVLANGDIRIVWQSDNGVDTNIYGATFTLPAVSTCANRSSTLVATKTYSPTRWTDATQAFSPAFKFAMPSEIPVTQGNSGNHWVTLSITSGANSTTCRFRGGADVAHPTTAAQIAKGARYVFDFCTGQGMSIRPGTIVTADRVTLHLDNGDSWRPSTQVRLVLGETCSAAAWPAPGHGDDDDDDGDDDDDDGHCGRGGGPRHLTAGGNAPDDTASAQQALGAEPGTPETAGCSSAGGLAWPMALMVLAMLMLRRRPVPAKIRLVAREEGRRLRG